MFIQSTFECGRNGLPAPSVSVVPVTAILRSHKEDRRVILRQGYRAGFCRCYRRRSTTNHKNGDQCQARRNDVIFHISRNTTVLQSIGFQELSYGLQLPDSQNSEHMKMTTTFKPETVIQLRLGARASGFSLIRRDKQKRAFHSLPHPCRLRPVRSVACMVGAPPPATSDR